MADEYTDQFEDVADIDAFDDALDRARAELAQMTDAASAADTVANDTKAYSVHEVAGVGRYAISRYRGWRRLLKIIHDPVANIDFSSKSYPTFDAVIGKNFASPYLLDPLNDKFESYKPLRDNLAAVRNFLMETYYVDTPPGMTPEKAKQALEEIATFVGKGLDNNRLFGGLIPNHDSSKPFIDLKRAMEPGGAGAQYIYEKILEMHRQSNWMRPFAAVAALFGGKPAPDWMLGAAHETGFTDFFETDTAPQSDTHAPTEEHIKAGIAQVEALEAGRQAAIDRHRQRDLMGDLDALANYLLHTAANIQNVAHLAEPVRQDAVEIAKEILRNLKVKLGSINVMEGLNLPPKTDMEAFGMGGIKGVAMVYERMLAWASGIDPRIMQDPSIIEATQAVGKMGYLAKREALRIAQASGNTKLAESLSAQLRNVPPAFSTFTGRSSTFGGLTDQIETGINTILNRVQTIGGPGAKIGFAAGNELGKSVNNPPTAGHGQQANNVGHAQPNQAVALNQSALQAAEHAQQAQASRAQSQGTNRARADGTSAGTSAGGQGTARASSSRTSSGQTRTVQRTSTVTTTTKIPINAPATALTPAQQQALHATASRHAQEHEEHEHQVKQLQLDAQRIAAQKAAAKAAMKNIDAAMLNQFKAATSTQGLVGTPVNPGSKAKNMYGKYVDPKTQPTAGYTAATTTAKVQSSGYTTSTKPPQPDPANPAAPLDDKQHPYIPQPPNRGGGRGF